MSLDFLLWQTLMLLAYCGTCFSESLLYIFENLKEPEDEKKDSLFVFIVDVWLDEVKV